MRIAFTGPESSGKTTLSKWLSTELLDSVYIPEFAREYLEERKIIRASENDFIQIVKPQCSLFNHASATTHQIFDTDIFVLRVWNDEIFKLNIPELEILPSYKMDIHFLCAPDVEWEADPLRSVPEETERTRLFENYKANLIEANSNFVVLNGSMDEKKSLILASLPGFAWK
jgi:nicotinamide riboside kinase